MNEKQTETPKKAKSKRPKKAPEAPNIMFVGDRLNAGAKDVAEGQKGFVARGPLSSLSVGMKTIKLPAAANQKKPFFHKDASTIVRLFPKLYKNYVEKGRK